MLTASYTAQVVEEPAQGFNSYGHSSSSAKHDRTRLEILRKDATLGRTFTSAPKQSNSVAPIRTAGSTTRMSQKSRRKLTLLVRNVEDYRYFLTLNYGSISPRDDRVAKKHLDRIKVWLTRRGLSLVWRQDFTKSGRVHFHLLLTGPVEKTALEVAWKRIIGVGDNARYTVHLGLIRNIESASRYLVKSKQSASNLVPTGYMNMGRFWGNSGPMRPKPEVCFEGTPRELAPLVRIALKIAKRHMMFRRRKRDNGVSGMVLWATGGTCLAQHLTRYWNSLHPDRPLAHPSSGLGGA